MKNRVFLLILMGSTLSACATSQKPDISGPPPPPPPPPPPFVVYNVSVTSDEATAAYAVPEEILSGLSPKARREHTEKYFTLIQLPFPVNGSLGDTFWVVPKCNGSVAWDLAQNVAISSSKTLSVSCGK